MTHQWAEPGPYTVMLFVEDPAGTITYSEVEILVKEPKLETYTGEVFIANPPDNLAETSILESQVDLTLTDESVSAVITFSYSFYLYIQDQNNPAENCVGYFEFGFSGEGPLANPLSLEMAQTHFKFSKEGPSCDQWSGSDPAGLVSTTLIGSFNNDGSFYGTLDPDQYIFRFFGITADVVED
jgi:hypothetical protein